MKEIKFRAWNKGTEYTLEHQHVIQHLYLCYLVWPTYDIFNDPAFVVMQYTGLKDKNGNEIYEGDILEFGDKSAMANIIYNQDRGRYQLVNLKAIPTKITFKNIAIDLTINIIDEDGLSVIGNIYENPELLKEDEDGCR